MGLWAPVIHLNLWFNCDPLTVDKTAVVSADGVATECACALNCRKVHQ